MKTIRSHCALTTAVAAALAMSSVAHAGMSRTDKGDNKLQVGGNGAHVKQPVQIAPRTGSTQIPFNPGLGLNGQKSGNTGIVPGNKIQIPVTDQGSNKGLPFKPGKIIDQKNTLPFNPNVKIPIDGKKPKLPFNPNVKIPIDVKKPILPFNPDTKIPIDPAFGKGPKIPLDPGIGNGKMPIKPIDPGFGNGHHGHHHHHPHEWCGGICRPNWVCPTIWWYPTDSFCGHLTGGYFTNPTVVVVDQTVAVDVALTDVRFCDAGDLVAKLGPRYRIVVRNKGLADVGQFHMVIMAGMDKMPKPDSPASLVKVIGLQAGEIKAFDVRLPVESLMMGADAAGKPVPFTSLFVVVDSHEELNEMDRTNNGTVMNRMEVPLVD